MNKSGGHDEDEPMRRKKKLVPGVRVDGAKRTNLTEQRRRRAAAPRQTEPVEDDRVSKAWDRQGRRDVVIAKAADEMIALHGERKRPRKETRSRDVPNPYYQPEHPAGRTNPVETSADINIRESAIETLFARGQLDKAQKKAADRFRMHWEALGGAGAGAMDFTREVVDGGAKRDPISERIVNASRELSTCRELLGARGYGLVCRVCGEGKALAELFVAKRDKLTGADNLRLHLTDLAEMWGLIKKKADTPARIRSQMLNGTKKVVRLVLTLGNRIWQTALIPRNRHRTQPPPASARSGRGRRDGRGLLSARGA